MFSHLNRNDVEMQHNFSRVPQLRCIWMQVGWGTRLKFLKYFAVSIFVDVLVEFTNGIFQFNQYIYKYADADEEGNYCRSIDLLGETL